MTHRWLILILLLWGSVIVCAQNDPDPCLSSDYDCAQGTVNNGLIFSFDTVYHYPAPGTSMPFWVAYGDTSNNTIDTTFAGSITAKLLSGPGSLTGTLTSWFEKYHYFNDFIFSAQGNYTIEFSIPGLATDTVVFSVIEKMKLCDSWSSGCYDGGATHVLPLSSNGGVIPVDAIFPITIAVYNPVTGYIDTSFVNFGHINQLSGPGSIIGTLSMYGEDWLTFPDIKFDTEGTYILELRADGGYIPDTVTVTVTPPSNMNILRVDDEVYPNPVANILNLGDEIMREYTSLSVFDISGKLVFMVPHITNQRIDVADFDSGSYVVVFSNNETQRRARSIFIKK